MSDLRHPCEDWAEPISLAAAGCLAPDEERDVRRHIETCSDCRERFRQLTGLCSALAEAQLPADGAEGAIVERVMSAVASGESGRSNVGMRAEMIHPTLLTRSLDTWRWIMRSPLSRVTAAAIFVLAVAGVALWFHGGGATPAVADFLEPILEAKTVKYKTTTEMKGPPALTGTAQVMMLNASRSRTETEVEMPNMPKHKTVTIWDGSQGKSLHLQPAQKQATLYDYVNMPKDKTPNQDPLGGLRAMLLDSENKPYDKREPLGKRDIDGRQVVGFRISLAGGVLRVWGDPKTGLPVRVETVTAMAPNAKITMSDFEFNVEMDESLFSLEPPAGYEVMVVRSPANDGSPDEEKDLIEFFRSFSRFSGGAFPDSLEMESLWGIVHRRVQISHSLEQPRKPSERRQEELSEAVTLLQRGLRFAVALPPEADSHYAGKDVSLGAADTPIFWYRPKDAKAYRVVYADLSVREAETPPAEPVAKPETDQDLIEMFREYSKWSGGPFPDSVDEMKLFLPIMMNTQYAYTSPEKPNKPSAKQEQETAKAQLKLERGLMFTRLLPPEADAHYAGKRVSLGAADTPIFWYRPKDSKKYRVIYADLSVREAAMPPSVPVALPEQDLIDTFRHYCELSGGPFPESLDMESLILNVSMKFLMRFPPEGGQPSAKHSQELTKSIMKLQPGLGFTASLPPEADAHYAGRGVSLGAVDTPVFWYRPKDSKRYRVVYADLSVRDAETPPSVPDAQPEEDLIDTFRHFSELSGGPFPDSLDLQTISQMIGRDFAIRMFLELAPGKGERHRIEELMRESMDLQRLAPEKGKPNKEQMDKIEEQMLDLLDWEKLAPGKGKPNKEQMDKIIEAETQKFMKAQTPKIMEATTRFQQGLLFARALPSEADAHYAGKGVSLGAADTPIFWYRPKDSKRYRVIYADLSVREADTRPEMPAEQAAPDPSSPKK